jgi:hypothetical protein
VANNPSSLQPEESPSWIDKIIRFCLENKLVVGLFVIFAIC